MTLPAAAEIRAVDTSAKPAARKRTPAKSTASRSRSTTAKARPPRAAVVPDPAAVVEPAPSRPRKRLLAVATVAFALTSIAATVVLLGDRGEPGGVNPNDAVAVSTEELAAQAAGLGTPVYWAGTLSGRTLELTSTKDGTFVRYLPAGTPVGGAGRALTVATYPLRDAYTTAMRRADVAGMTSSRTKNGGVAVWSRVQPTSVYVAFRGVPSLVEVYAPRASDARALALAGRVRPVR
jgi:hypothetical protein